MIRLEKSTHSTYLIVDEKTGKDILFQFDEEFPVLARTFGWKGIGYCHTVEGLLEAIGNATKYLDNNIGKIVKDPRYFN